MLNLAQKGKGNQNNNREDQKEEKVGARIMQSLRNNENNDSGDYGAQIYKEQGESLTFIGNGHAEKQTVKNMANESQEEREFKRIEPENQLNGNTHLLLLIIQQD